jgi:hypothetical protein
MLNQKNKLKLKKMGLESNMFLKSDNNRPSVEVKYELTYSGDLLKVTQYNQTARHCGISKQWKTKIRDWYRMET